MLAYLIQCHTQFDYVERLVRWLWRPDDTFIISINRESVVPESFRATFAPFPNVKILQNIPIVWSGASIVSANLSAIATALSMPGDWHYFINITGADIPLKSPEQIKDTLKNNAVRGFQNYVAYFDVTPKFIEFTEGEERGAEKMLSNREDNAFQVYRAAAEHFRDRDVSPIMHPDLRTALYCAETPGSGGHYARPLYAQESAMRRRFFDLFPCRCGRVGVVLHRKTCEWLSTAFEPLLAFEVFKSIFSSEEMYFHTLLWGSKELDQSTFVNANFRFHSGHPETIVDDMLPDLQKDDAFFARKIELPRAEKILNWIDSFCKPHHEMTHAHTH